MTVQTLASFVTITLAYRLLVIVMINCMYECLFTHIDGVYVTGLCSKFGRKSSK
jgi:hypothetical protein